MTEQRRRVLYVAHCLRPTEEEIEQDIAMARAVNVVTTRDNSAMSALQRNLRRAKAFFDWLRDAFVDVTFVAPWIGQVAMGDDDSDPAQRERGMRDNFALIAKLDGVVLCGPRISAGMHAEVDALLERVVNIDQPRPGDLYDLTPLGATPPAELPGTETFDHWARRIAGYARPLTLDDVWCHSCTAAKLGAAGPCRKHGEAP